MLSSLAGRAGTENCPFALSEEMPERESCSHRRPNQHAVDCPNKRAQKNTLDHDLSFFTASLTFKKSARCAAGCAVNCRVNAEGPRPWPANKADGTTRH